MFFKKVLFLFLSVLLNSFQTGLAFVQPFDLIESSANFMPSFGRDIDHSNQVPYDPAFSMQWGLFNTGQIDADGQVGFIGSDIKIVDALEVYNPKREVVLAILDSGLDMNHEDLDYSNLWVNVQEQNGIDGKDDDGNGYVDDIFGMNTVTNLHDILDSNFHGTHVGGLIAAISNNNKGIFGRVPGIKIMILKIWDNVSIPSRTSEGSNPTADAIRYACANGANVLSNSYGGAFSNKAIKTAIEFCAEKGAVFVSAVGNNYRSLDEFPVYPSAYTLPNQIAVGASDNQDSRALFSNYGQVVDIFSPGKDILSLIPNNDYRWYSGTSEACPLVALGVAMTLAHNPQLNALELKERIVKGGDESDRLMRWSSSGRRLNIFNSLLGKKGKRVVRFDSSNWAKESKLVETPHPYPRNKTLEFEIHKEGIKRFRIHFNKFEVYFLDVVEIRDREDKIVERYNFGQHVPFWSNVIEGDYAKVILRAKKPPYNYGFTIDQIKYEL